MTTCYLPSVNDKQRTDKQRTALARLGDLQRDMDDAEARYDAALEERNALFVQLHKEGVGATEMGKATGLDRTTVQRICTPPRTPRRS